jgi:hypothetical protein
VKQPQPVVFRQQVATPGPAAPAPTPKVEKPVAPVIHHEPVPLLCTALLPSHGSLNPKLKING